MVGALLKRSRRRPSVLIHIKSTTALAALIKRTFFSLIIVNSAAYRNARVYFYSLNEETLRLLIKCRIV